METSNTLKYNKTINIDKENIGIIIGSNGKTISSIKKESGASIQIKSHLSPGGNCKIYGTKHQIEKAIMNIKDIIEKKNKESNNKEEKSGFKYNMSDLRWRTVPQMPRECSVCSVSSGDADG